jgi:hypothetical protein
MGQEFLIFFGGKFWKEKIKFGYSPYTRQRAVKKGRVYIGERK